MTKWLPAALTCTVLILGGPLPLPGGVGQTPLRLTGPWCGTAEILDDWTEHRTIDVTMFIATDGTVAGTVGSATLLHARLQANRGWFGRWLRIKTDWIVTGSLDGYLIPGEGLKGARLVMPLDWIDDHFEGSLVATIPGPIGRTTLTAGHLRLERLGAIAELSQNGDRHANR